MISNYPYFGLLCIAIFLLTFIMLHIHVIRPKLYTVEDNALNLCFNGNNYGPFAFPTTADTSDGANFVNQFFLNPFRSAFNSLPDSIETGISGRDTGFAYSCDPVSNIVNGTSFADGKMMYQLQTFPSVPDLPLTEGASQTVYASVPVRIEPQAYIRASIFGVGVVETYANLTMCFTVFVSVNMVCAGFKTTAQSVKIIDVQVSSFDIDIEDGRVEAAFEVGDFFANLKGLIRGKIVDQIRKVEGIVNDASKKFLPYDLPFPICTAIAGNVKTVGNITYSGLYGYRPTLLPATVAGFDLSLDDCLAKAVQNGQTWVFHMEDIRDPTQRICYPNVGTALFQSPPAGTNLIPLPSTTVKSSIWQSSSIPFAPNAVFPTYSIRTGVRFDTTYGTSNRFNVGTVVDIYTLLLSNPNVKAVVCKGNPSTLGSGSDVSFAWTFTSMLSLQSDSDYFIMIKP